VCIYTPVSLSPPSLTKKSNQWRLILLCSCVCACVCFSYILYKYLFVLFPSWGYPMMIDWLIDMEIKDYDCYVQSSNERQLHEQNRCFWEVSTKLLNKACHLPAFWAWDYRIIHKTFSIRAFNFWIGYQSKFPQYNCGTLALLSVPAVHLVPVHPVAQLQELGAIHVPPFGHDVAPEHRAETQMKSKVNIVQLKIAIEYSYHDSLSPHILNSRYYMTADDRQCMTGYCIWKTRFCQLFQVLDVLCRQVLFVTVTFWEKERETDLLKQLGIKLRTFQLLYSQTLLLLSH